MDRDNKQYIDKLIRILEFFSKALGMKISLNKSCTYEFDKYTHNLLGLQIMDGSGQRRHI